MVDLQLALSAAIPVVFVLLLLFAKRLVHAENLDRFLVVLLLVGLSTEVLWPSRGAGFGTYTQAAKILDARGVHLYSVFGNPPQPEAPPLGLMILGAMYAVVPSAFWVTAVSIYQAALNGVIAFATYKLAKGTLGLVAACLVVFNPFFFAYSLLNLSPDQLMFALVMVGLCLLKLGKPVWSSFVFGLALVSMQSAVFFLIPIGFYFFLKYGKRMTVELVSIVSGILVVVSLPFALVDSAYADHVWLGEFVRVGFGSAQHLYDPNFAGLSSYLAYLHETTNIDLGFVYSLGPVFFLIVLASVIYIFYNRRDIDLTNLAFLSLMPFYLTIWNTAYGADPINPWRLYFFIPFATVIWLRERSLVGKACLASILAALLYRAADYAAFITNAPNEYLLLTPGNLVLPACFLAYLIVEFYARKLGARAQIS